GGWVGGLRVAVAKVGWLARESARPRRLRRGRVGHGWCPLWAAIPVGVAPQRRRLRGPGTRMGCVLEGDHIGSEHPWPPPGVRPPCLALHARPAEPRPPGTTARLLR